MMIDVTQIQYDDWGDIDLVLGYAKEDKEPKTFRYTSALHIMQSTGFRDKNGKEIFEGDVVEYVRNPTVRKVINFGEIINDEYGLQGYGWNIVCSEEYEIIGNVYEKPDLLPTP